MLCPISSRVFKGMKIFCASARKIINFQVFKAIPEKNTLIVKGSVPGSKGSYLITQLK